jgi:two-component system, OmpR family, response regulator VanR
MQEAKDKIEILIVEDSPTQAEELKYILETHGFHVWVTQNGMEALDYLENRIPSIIVSDIIMPEMDGYGLCKKIKSEERTKNIPVMLLTTLSEPEDVIKGLDCLSDGFMIKPYDEEALISRINYILLNTETRKSATTEMGIEIVFAGKKHFITSTRIQILDLLISIYENGIQKARELEKTVKDLKSANETIKTLKGFIPICAMCKKVRDDQGYWQQIELYIRDHSEADFSHGYCPECMEKLYPEYFKKKG